MSKKRTKSETGLLEQWRIALTNAQEQPEVQAQIVNYGYNKEKLAEGEALWKSTKEIWKNNKQEDQESQEASNNFKTEKEKLYSLYSTHRKKAKAKFKRNTEILLKLQVEGSKPTNYLSKLQLIKHFYTQVNQNEEIATQLQTYNISQEELTTATGQIKKVEEARAKYLKEKGESQDATKQKDEAIATLEYWMQDFYAMASIALEENPQLLESIGLFRKS